MRELKTAEVARVSGAGRILEIAKNTGSRIGKLFGHASFGGRVGKGVGSFLELIPGSGIVNCILGHICPSAQDPVPTPPPTTPAPAPAD